MLQHKRTWLTPNTSLAENCCEEREQEFRAESKSSCQSLSAKMWEVLRRKPGTLRSKEKLAGGNDRVPGKEPKGISEWGKPTSRGDPSPSGLLKAKMETRGVDHQKAKYLTNWIGDSRQLICNHFAI